MSTLSQPHVVDLESVNCNNVGGGGGGGCCRFAAMSEGGGQQLSEANEIVRIAENNGTNEKESSVSECRVEILDLRLGKNERDCRICYMSIDVANQDSECIELGCSCKDDLAVAHKQCAEAWFKIKGNKTCEICGSTAKNVSGVKEAESTQQCNAANAAAAATATTSSESRNFWLGHGFLNFLLACMVFAFVISWLFHFNVES